MGYQESFFRMKRDKDFDKLVECIKGYGRDNFAGGTPVEIITLLKPIKGDLKMQCHEEKQYSFKAGKKFIYVVGERYNQRCSSDFFETCKNVPLDILKDLEIYFTECFPSDDIFENNETAKMATHEEFIWNDDKEVK